MNPLLPRITRRTALGVAGVAVLAGCARDVRGSGPTRDGSPGPRRQGTPESTSPAPATPADAATMVTRATVPVLCYHQLRDWASGDSGYNKSLLICPPDNFRRQLDGLKDGGFTTISPAQYLDHLRTGAALPEKPVMLTFDDGKDSQPLVAGPELAKRGMTGTFFVMSVVIGNNGWITKRQIEELAGAGHTIGAHTWDHHNVTKYAGKDWAEQLEKPRATLREISRQEVDTLAYPYGAWNAAALPHVRSAGYTSAYQLMDKGIDHANPELTLRRSLVTSTWDAAGVVKALSRL